MALLLAALSAGCDSGGSLISGFPNLVSIAVTPATTSVPIGISKQFTAIATYSDGSSHDVTAVSIWTSGNPPVATVVSTSGLATGVSAGTATITATLNGKSGSATLTVPVATLVSIAVTPATATVQIGLTKTLVATGAYSDGSSVDISATVAWTSNNTPVATVVSPGIATAVSAGTATITATLGGKSGSATLTVPVATLVSIAVTPATATVQIGLTKTLVATGAYSDGSSVDISATVAWTSNNTPVATVVSPGIATAVSAGTATITATLGGKSGSATLTVPVATLVSIAVIPATATVQIGLTKTLVATGAYSDGSSVDISATVAWTSNNTPVATVVSPGIATAVSAGTATITATLNGKSGSANLTVPAATLVSIAVTPATASVPMGITQQFTAIATYSDGSSIDVTATSAWLSGTPGVATILSTGIATGVASGTSVITATYSGQSNTAALIVTPATLASIAVTPATASVPMGITQPFTAIATYSDGSSIDVTATSAWLSGTPGVATILSTGIATGVASGTSVITATYSGQSNTAALIVTPATLASIAVTPATASVPMGITQPFTAIATYSDGSSIDVTATSAWLSGTPGVATILSTGIATGVASGTSVITATYSGQSNTATLTVTPATLASIAVTPPTATVQIGLTQTFVATGTYSDGSSVDISTAVVWTSGNTSVATIVSPGVATAVSAGAATITATLGGKSGSAVLTVPAATLVSIAVTPATALIPATGTQQFTATATYSDGTTANVTTGTIWTSANVPLGGAAVATLSPDGTGGGMATGNVIGQSLITATLGGQTATATLNVTVNLRRAANFGVVAGTGLTNAQVTMVSGDVGALNETSIPTITAGYSNYVGADASFTDALADLTPAMNDAYAPACTTDYGNSAVDYGNQSLAPGIYCNGASAIYITGGPLSLNSPGVYIFRTGGALTPALPVQFTGAGMTSANTSVFWIVGSASTSAASWLGTILSTGAITLQAGSTLIDGRVLTTAAATLNTNMISRPFP